MEIKFSLEFTTVLSYAREEAMRTGSYSIAADHLLLAGIRHRDNAACEALTALGIDLEELKAFVWNEYKDLRDYMFEQEMLEKEMTVDEIIDVARAKFGLVFSDEIVFMPED